MKKGVIFLLCLSFVACSQETPRDDLGVSTSEPDRIETELSPLPEEVDDIFVDNIFVEEIPPEPEPELIYRNHQEEGGYFELPLAGATGFVGISTSFYESPGSNSLSTLAPGQAFCILGEEGEWWHIEVHGQNGYIRHENCLINLPDLIPSIIYDNPYANICYSCSLGKDIPNVTGEQLYEALYYNYRYGADIYLTPVLYQVAKKLQTVQNTALADGNSLLIFECYRPMNVQLQLVNGLAQLMNQDAQVNAALTAYPWSKDWFVSTGISGHQQGKSVDMTLVTVLEEEIWHSGDYEYRKITSYEEKNMPTQFDELSPLAATYSQPVYASNWRSGTYANTMTADAILLQHYATSAGFVPLASEWWHFDDYTAGGGSFTGNFTVNQCLSQSPLSTE